MLFKNSFAAAGVAARRSIPFWIVALVINFTGSCPEASTILFKIKRRDRLRLSLRTWKGGRRVVIRNSASQCSRRKAERRWPGLRCLPIALECRPIRRHKLLGSWLAVDANLGLARQANIIANDVLAPIDS